MAPLRQGKAFRTEIGDGDHLHSRGLGEVTDQVGTPVAISDHTNTYHNSSLMRTVTGHDGTGCCEQNSDVQPQGPCPGVSQIETDHIIEPNSAPSRYLPQTSDPGLRIDEAPAVPRLVALKFVGQRWSGPDEGHVAG